MSQLGAWRLELSYFLFPRDPLRGPWVTGRVSIVIGFLLSLALSLLSAARCGSGSGRHPPGSWCWRTSCDLTILSHWLVLHPAFLLTLLLLSYFSFLFLKWYCTMDLQIIIIAFCRSAWRLALGACSLRLFVAVNKTNCRAAICRILMFPIWYIFNFFIPAISAIFAFVILLRSGTRGAGWDNCWRVGPASSCRLVNHRHTKSDC